MSDNAFEQEPAEQRALRHRAERVLAGLGQAERVTDIAPIAFWRGYLMALDDLTNGTAGALARKYAALADQPQGVVEVCPAALARHREMQPRADVQKRLRAFGVECAPKLIACLHIDAIQQLENAALAAPVLHDEQAAPNVDGDNDPSSHTAPQSVDEHVLSLRQGMVAREEWRLLAFPDGAFQLHRYTAGRVIESYWLSSREHAAVALQAVLHGFEPPRRLCHLEPVMPVRAIPVS